MSQKESTYFIYDQSPTMAGRLDDSIEYSVEIIMNKIIRGKKQDKIGIATIHDKSTSNPMNDLDPDDWFNFKVDSAYQFSWYSLLELINDRVGVNETAISDFECDIPRSLAATLQLIENLNPKNSTKQRMTAKEKFTIILMSDLKNESSWEGLIEPIDQVATRHDVLIILIYFPMDRSTCTDDELENYETNLHNLNALVNVLKEKKIGRVTESYLTSFDNAVQYVKDWNKEPPKYVKPMKVFSGKIRIGCDVNSLDLKSCIESLHYESVYENFKVDYDESADLYSLNVPVEGYPMIKVDKPVLFNEVGVRLNNEGKKEIFDISLNREKFAYIKKRRDDQDDGDEDDDDGDEDDDDNDDNTYGGTDDDLPPKGLVVQHLTPDQIQQGYKYGSSIIPVTAPLKEQITIPSYPGIDIIQFCNKAEIPPWYYRDEPIILLPHSNCSLRDQMGFNSLSQSMLKQDLVGIVRYIQKQGSIVRLAALVPTIVLTDKTKNDEYPSGGLDGEGVDKKRDFEQMNDDDLRKDYFGFTLVSLTFLGDEKIPRLFNLNGVYKSGDDDKENANSKFDKESFPTPEMVESMDKFIESMDLDAQISEKENGDDVIIENDYVELNDFDTLPLIPTKGIEIQTNYKEVSDVTRKLLSQNSFKIHLTGKLIKAIYQLHLENSKEGDALFDLVEKSKDETIGDKPFFDDFIDKFVEGLVITDSNTGKSVFKEQLNIDEELVGHMKSLFNIERKVKEEARVSNDDKQQNENGEEKLPPVSELLKEFD